MKKVIVKYDDLLDIDKLFKMYHIIKNNTKHRDKIFKYETNLTTNLINILDKLKNKNYVHGEYNLFLIYKPKCRVIMSEKMDDKIVNHLISYYVLKKIIEPKLIDFNVATRTGKGTKMGIEYIKKYINYMKNKYDKFYILKCDISKYFYNIDHDILKNKLIKDIKDKDILNILFSIINSTNSTYVNNHLNKNINKRKEFINNLTISNKEKEYLLNEINNIPLYNYNKGLPIGNMTSQILAVYYLNDIDHYIKEKLRVKCYVRYMDDMILMHGNKNYLKECYYYIKCELKKVKLFFNNKTQIIEIHNGFNFLGCKFILKSKKLLILLNNKTKRRILNRIKYEKIINKKLFLFERYNGYLSRCNSNGFIYKI